MGMASFSKGSGSLLAFAWGLCVESSSDVTCGSTVYGAVASALAADSWLDLLRVTANVGDEKP
jgi:hypothetical protein